MVSLAKDRELISAADRPDLLRLLACLTPRRFDVLLAAARLQRPFTVAALRDVLPAELATSLPRDVVALERGGLLIGDPPLDSVHHASRQGHTVTYTVCPDVPRMFVDLADAVERAWSAA